MFSQNLRSSSNASKQSLYATALPCFARGGCGDGDTSDSCPHVRKSSRSIVSLSGEQSRNAIDVHVRGSQLCGAVRLLGFSSNLRRADRNHESYLPSCRSFGWSPQVQRICNVSVTWRHRWFCQRHARGDTGFNAELVCRWTGSIASWRLEWWRHWRYMFAL